MGAGDSDPRLFRVQGGDLFVIRYKNNPHRLRSLVNDYVGSRIAEELGLPCLQVEIVELSKELIEANDLCKRYHAATCEWTTTNERLQAGLQFGSPFVKDGQNGVPELIKKVTNLSDIPGSILFDTWTMNDDRKRDRNLFVSWVGTGKKRRYKYLMIDHDQCFTGSSWNENIIRESGYTDRLFGMHPALVETVEEPSDFDEWFEAINAFPESAITRILEDVPDEWSLSANEKAALRAFLIERRKVLRACFHKNLRHFPFKQRRGK
ncbi:MAG: hypothetical protein C4520_03940 [Candidatus Abyssobacteria bacterium SURF_5]|uniref:HipA-like kinase domain-containing protein n=1 Tax=Abyssobacteria bacterium (strain SURF_5) TaxID=2093360 RepID=A0A3A4P231_ABYX5|nr:MAG: hypothetical protein C4520_03940 [Candidatus Abyssubacteria bacterium SURF_5]